MSTPTLVVIAVILAISVGQRWADEYRAERAGAALRDNVRHRAVAVRSGIAGSVDVVQDENPYTIAVAGAGATAPPRPGFQV
ncbi:hypothetical protein DMB66_02550 [Actinoplanes sp. ATCC 53533]|uniref:hypothetical protein n=1 Tax=Actinoplanes sp. ATCC 53533 TaxID=1288362 RepID=UPI000F791866|nr:hypothetical protein [Actinoplanes sp. ATCC 53533]RSM73801.1 hypothetical protein DMB66_02550 [Actinoplanes sp. ATCC 53533]